MSKRHHTTFFDGRELRYRVLSPQDDVIAVCALVEDAVMIASRYSVDTRVVWRQTDQKGETEVWRRTPEVGFLDIGQAVQIARVFHGHRDSAKGRAAAEHVPTVSKVLTQLGRRA